MSDERSQSGLVRALGPVDATTIVVGSMIGSGIFITSAESARLSGAPGWLVLAWTLLLALPLWRFYVARGAAGESPCA